MVWRLLKLANLLIKLSLSMLPRFCNRAWLRVTTANVEVYLKCNKIARGYTGLVEHRRCILTYTRESREGYKQQIRFYSHSGTIKGLVLRYEHQVSLLAHYLIFTVLGERFFFLSC
jgi:hypothetical protein